MVKGGVFFMQIYGKKHSYYSYAQEGPDGANREALVAAGAFGTFYSEEELRSLFSEDWELLAFDESVRVSHIDEFVYSDFNVVAKKR